jgi:D-alanyl-D-alanine carboxypeptidase
MEVMHVSLPPVKRKDLVVVPQLSASGMLLVDMVSGEEIISKNANTSRPMASLTKIMTALIILEHHRLSEMVTVPAIAGQIQGSAVGLKPGNHFSVESLLKALLIPSANDAAYTLAAYHGHSVGEFVTQMNERAQALGLSHTHFANPAGLDNEEQYSSPRDLAALTRAALNFPAFRAIVSTRGTAIAGDDGKEITLRNTNELLHEDKNVYGVKTGTTEAAEECLIVLFTQNEREYLLILLGSRDRYTDSLRILQAMRSLGTS